MEQASSSASRAALPEILLEPRTNALPQTSSNVLALASGTNIPAAAATEPIVTTAKSPEPSTSLGPSFEIPRKTYAEPGFIAPQMLVPFFQSRPMETNLLEGPATAPVIFIPPTRSERASSKASLLSP